MKRKKVSKSKFARMRKDARRMKSMHLGEKQRRLIFLSGELERYCDRNKIEGGLRKDILGMVSFDQSGRKYDAIRAVAESHDQRAFKPLMFLLKQGGPGEDVIVRALGTLGDRRAFKPLVEILKQEKSQLKEPAASALGDLGDKRAVEPLIEVLHGKIVLMADYFSRQAAAISLGKLKDPRAIPHVDKMIEAIHDQAKAVYQAAYTLLEHNASARDRAAIQMVKPFLERKLDEFRAPALMIALLRSPEEIKRLPTDLKDKKRQRGRIDYLKNLIDGAKDHQPQEIIKIFKK